MANRIKFFIGATKPPRAASCKRRAEYVGLGRDTMTFETLDAKTVPLGEGNAQISVIKGKDGDISTMVEFSGIADDIVAQWLRSLENCFSATTTSFQSDPSFSLPGNYIKEIYDFLSGKDRGTDTPSTTPPGDGPKKPGPRPPAATQGDLVDRYRSMHSGGGPTGINPWRK
jgi:hypothetical protein